jgi:hypothetical protein
MSIEYEQTEAQVRIDRFFLHHPEHEQHPVAVFFRELMDDGVMVDGYGGEHLFTQEDVNESSVMGYEEGYADGMQHGREYQYDAALRLIGQSKTVEEAAKAMKGEQP